MNFSTMFEDFRSKLNEEVMSKLESWLETLISMLPEMVMALLVLIVFFFIGKLVRKACHKLLSKATMNKTVIDLLETIAGILVVGVGIFIALSVLDLDGAVTSLLAGAGIVGLALGFAFQDIASNFISGIILTLRHPFGIGDIIETKDVYGTVRKLNLRNTILQTPQGQVVYIPNKIVFENPLTNFTADGQRRIDLGCGVSYGDDLQKVKKLAIEAIEELEGYNSDRDILFFFEEFGGSSVNFKVCFWVNFRTNPDFLDMRSEAMIALKQKFDKHDIMIPFPIRTLDFGIRGGEKLDSMLVGDKNGHSHPNGDSNGGEE
jgi:small-conductance mechanosensitive channel